MRRALPFALFALAVACRQIVGIDHVELGDAGGDAGPGMPSQVFNRGSEPIVKILSDGQYVYALLGSSIVRCKVTGCGTTPDMVVPNVASGLINDFAMAARIYYSQEGTTATLGDGGMPPANDGSIRVCDKDGKNDAVFLPGLPAPSFMAIAGDLYWFDDQDDIAADNPKNTMRRCPLTGGCGQGTSVMDNLGGLGTAVAADVKSVYVLTGDSMNVNDAVYACATGTSCGAMPRIALTNIDSASYGSIAADGTYLYFTLDSKGDILRIDQQNMVKPLVGGQVGTKGITSDGKHVYWGTSNGAVMRVPVEGGPPQMIASGQAKPDLLTTDATNVYWVVESGQGSSVMTLPKP